MIFSKKGLTVEFNNTIVPTSNILTKYGEWSIKAKAVDIIDNDLYAPEMTTGIYNNHDAILVAKDNAVYVAKANWGSQLVANATVIAKRGDKLPDVESYGDTSGGEFVFSKDYVRAAPNIDDPTKIDSILIVESGTHIKKASTDSEFDLVGGTYLNTYLAGGYKNLKLKFDNISDTIFGEVLPKLKAKGVSELKFKPWTKGGRIQADADIWAFNEQLKLASFNPLYAKQEAFDSTKYYVAYLGDQVAGTKGTLQFVKPPENPGTWNGSGADPYDSDFDKAADSMRIDSVGYDTTGKLYHLISAIQKNHRRLVMLGFQPSYLDSVPLAKDLLLDATLWISVDDFKLPKPLIKPADGSNIFTWFDEMNFEVDFSLKGDKIKKEAYEFKLEVTYGSTTVDTLILVPADDGSIEIDSFTILLSDLGIDIDSTDLVNTKIDFSVEVSPADTFAFFDGNSASATLNIYKLTKPILSNSMSEFTGSMTETMTCSTTTSPTDSSGIVGASINWTLGSGSSSGTSPLDVTISETGTLTAFASLAGYINSEDTSKTYQKNADGFGLEKAYYLDTNSVPDGYADLIVVTFNDSTLKILEDYPNLTTQSVLDTIAAGLDIPDNLTLDALVATDTGFIIYVTDDKTSLPDTDKKNDLLKQTLTDTVGDVGFLDPQDVPILDSMAPVIIIADFDPDGNKLTITFSEKTAITELTDNTFIFTDFEGNTYTVTDITYDDPSGNGSAVHHFIVGAITDSNGDTTTIKSGDFIQLKGDTTVVDLKEIAQNKTTKKVPITVDLYPIGLESATFLDIPVGDVADGKIDQIYVELNSATLSVINDGLLSLQDVANTLNSDKASGTLKLLLLDNDDKDNFPAKNLTIDSVGVLNDSLIVYITDNAVTPNTSDQDDKLADTDLDTVANVASLAADTLDIIDGVAPVLIKVIVNPHDKEDSTSIGTVTLIFSEDVEVPNDNIKDNLIFTDKKGQTYTLDLDYDGPNVKSDEHIYTIKTSKTGKTVYPLDKDTVTLVGGTGITDGTNIQDKDGNPIVIAVGPYPITTTTDVIGPFTVETEIPDGLLDFVGIVDKSTLIGPNVTDGKVKGTALVITISNAEITSPQMLYSEVTIFDVVGNIVAKADVDGPKPSNLTVTVTDMPNSPKYAITTVWTGKNDLGRNVGTGNYLVIVSLKRYENGRLIDLNGFPKTRTLLVKQGKEQ